MNNISIYKQDAANIGLTPKHQSAGHCCICPLGFLYVPLNHLQREEIQEALLTIANTGYHPIYVNLHFCTITQQVPCNGINQYTRELNRMYHFDTLHNIIESNTA